MRWFRSLKSGLTWPTGPITKGGAEWEKGVTKPYLTADELPILSADIDLGSPWAYLFGRLGSSFLKPNLLVLTERRLLLLPTGAFGFRSRSPYIAERGRVTLQTYKRWLWKHVFELGWPGGDSTRVIFAWVQTESARQLFNALGGQQLGPSLVGRGFKNPKDGDV